MSMEVTRETPIATSPIKSAPLVTDNSGAIMIAKLEAAARRIVELGSKATAAPWRRVGKTGYINGRDDTASRRDAEVRVADVGAYRDKGLLRFNRDRWDADLDFIAFTRNHAPALAAEYLRLREVEKALEAEVERLKEMVAQTEDHLTNALLQRDLARANLADAYLADANLAGAQPYRSAPELLEALREIRRLCSAAANDGKSAAVRESNVNRAWHVASAAIAAATGEG